MNPRNSLQTSKEVVGQIFDFIFLEEIAVLSAVSKTFQLDIRAYYKIIFKQLPEKFLSIYNEFKGASLKLRILVEPYLAKPVLPEEKHPFKAINQFLLWMSTDDKISNYLVDYRLVANNDEARKIQSEIKQVPSFPTVKNINGHCASDFIKDPKTKNLLDEFSAHRRRSRCVVM